MDALCCKVKILFYVILIVYLCYDFWSDWYHFKVLYKEKKFSGISMQTNRTTLLAVEVSFGISCVTATLLIIFMIWTYGYYAKFHWYCLNHLDYGPVGYSDGEVSLPQNRRSDEKCNPKFITLELRLSVLELLFKDDIQSGILFWIYKTQPSVTITPDWMSIGFSVCSIVAHSKLALCFITKLCGCGEGEGPCWADLCSDKMFICLFGLIGSILCLVLTVAYLVNALNPV